MNSPVDLARTLLARARDDAYVLRQLAADRDAPDWVLGFHAQQSVEKSIKAVLAARGTSFPHTHNLVMLIALLLREGCSAPPHEELISTLVPYGAAMRYDDSLADELAPLNRSEIHQCVTSTLEWAAGLLA